MLESPLCSSSDSKDWKTSPFLEIPWQLQQPQAGKVSQKWPTLHSWKAQPGCGARQGLQRPSQSVGQSSMCCETAWLGAAGWWRTVGEGGEEEPGLFQQGIIQENEDDWRDFSFLLQPPMWDRSYQGSAESGEDQHLLPLPFYFVYIRILLSGRTVFCIPDRDNEIHSGQGERGWWVRQHRQPKPRPWLSTATAQQFHTIAVHPYTQESASFSFLPLPPIAPSLTLCLVPKGTKVHLWRRNSSAWDLLRILKIPFSLGFFTSNWVDKRFDLCIPLINSWRLLPSSLYPYCKYLADALLIFLLL